MAMTRGIQPRIPEGGVAHMDDGELLDKEGKPIPTTGHVVARQPPPEAPERTGGLTFLPVDEAPPAPPEPPAMPEPTPQPTARVPGPPESTLVWRCDPSTMARDATGWELAHLLGIFLDRPFFIDLPDDMKRSLPADVQRHFRRLP